MSVVIPEVLVKDLLVTAGVGTFGGASGWSINIGRLPAKPLTAIAIIQTGGLAANPKYLLDWPSIQIMVRGGVNGYAAARNKVQEIKDKLLGLPSQTLSGERIVQINMIGDISSLGFDDQDRPLFSANFQMIIEPSSGTNRIAL